MVYKQIDEKPLPISLITAGEETQMRYATRDETVAEYAEMISDPNVAWPFDSKLVVFHDGTDYWLADGFHRYRAAERAGRTSVHCVIYDGDLEAAQDYALGANASHGLRRNNEDKRKAVRMALSMDRWETRSNRDIADHVGVSESFVRKMRGNDDDDSGAHRAHLKTTDTVKTEAKRIGKDGKSYPAAKSKPKPEPVTDDEYEDFEPPEEVEEPELSENLEPIRAKLRTHFAEDELPTAESQYKAISKLGVEGAIDVVELARERMTGDEPKLQDYRDAVKQLDARYAFSICLQHIEAAMRGIDDCNRHKPDGQKHAVAMQFIQSCWNVLKEWRA